MVQNFLTLDTFKKGVTNYLKSKTYGNAERDDLWRELTRAGKVDNQLLAGDSIKEVMDTWTLKPGYPVLTVTSSTDKTVSMNQKRFYLSPNVANPHKTTWTIPINVAYPLASNSGFNKTTPDKWFMANDASFTIEIQEHPYVINVQQTGYYRVNYDEKNWQHLAKVLKQDLKKIHKNNRAQILDDATNLARGNQMSYDMALALTEYLDKEDEFMPWMSALNAFTFIGLMLNDNSSLNEYGYLKKGPS